MRSARIRASQAKSSWPTISRRLWSPRHSGYAGQRSRPKNGGLSLSDGWFTTRRFGLAGPRDVTGISSVLICQPKSPPRGSAMLTEEIVSLPIYPRMRTHVGGHVDLECGSTVHLARALGSSANLTFRLLG